MTQRRILQIAHLERETKIYRNDAWPMPTAVKNIRSHLERVSKIHGGHMCADDKLPDAADILRSSSQLPATGIQKVPKTK